MAEVVLKNLVKTFGDVVAVKDVNLTVHDREFLVLVGPSGCGKTSTLRMVAGSAKRSAFPWTPPRFTSSILTPSWPSRNQEG